MHGGRCQDFGSGLNCSCSEDYTGIGCQYEYDACQAGACKNGATCIDHGSGSKCICAPGFTGKFCDEDVVDCKENSCPPSATCIDLTGKFYCQCPFNLTGEDCRKSKYCNFTNKLFRKSYCKQIEKIFIYIFSLQLFKWIMIYTLVTQLEVQLLK